MTALLSGIRVLEIGDRIATAYCGKLLRDAGAEVVMVEPPPPVIGCAVTGPQVSRHPTATARSSRSWPAANTASLHTRSPPRCWTPQIS